LRVSEKAVDPSIDQSFSDRPKRSSAETGGSLAESLAMIAGLPLSADEKAAAVRRLLAETGN
jgi:hypothetical protein